MASLLCVLAFALAAMAQDTDEQGVPTLRAYANRIQVPTLVLSKSRWPMARVAEDRFYVSLDGGPKFRVNHAWLEGNDPISLAVLLDLTQRDAGIMQKMDDAIAGLAAGSLHAEDRVWVYSLGCNLVRTKEGIPAEAALLKNAVDLSLQQWDTWKHDRNKSDCTMQWHLRDSIAEIVAQLAKQPGWRVLLVAGPREQDVLECRADNGAGEFGRGVRDGAASG